MSNALNNQDLKNLAPEFVNRIQTHTTNDKVAEQYELEGIASNIVHQIGDALYEALPKDVAHNHFVSARQATNDIAIDFAKKLISEYVEKERNRI